MAIEEKGGGKWAAQKLSGFFFWTAYASFLVEAQYLKLKNYSKF